MSQIQVCLISGGLSLAESLFPDHRSYKEE